MAVLVTVIKEGEKFSFYRTLMPLTLLGILIQVSIAIAVVCKHALSNKDDDERVARDGACATGKKSMKVKRSTFNICLQLLTLFSIFVNLAVNAFFTARVIKEVPVGPTEGT